MKNDNLSSVIQEVKDYFKVSLNLLKLDSIEQCSTLLAQLIIDTLVLLIFLTALIFISIALIALATGVLHSRAYAFGALGIFYIFLTGIAYRFKLSIKNFVIRRLLSIFLKKNK